MELFFFTTDLKVALKSQKAGIDSVIVDWERKGKKKRQSGYALETNADSPKDVRRLSNRLCIPVTVRINPLHQETASEVEHAIEHGAGIIMLPMARHPDEVQLFLKIVRQRARTIIQIETPELVRQVQSFKKLKWDIAYIGLNDLMVASGRHSIWQALIDGTAERICRALNGRKYGFGGSTVLGGGEPIVNILILHELVRLGGCVTVMRRTFKRELLDRDLPSEIRALRLLIECSRRRGPRARQYDHRLLCTIIRKLISFSNQSHNIKN